MVKKSDVAAASPDDESPIRRFSLKLKEVQVELEAPDGGVKTYTIRELTGAKRDDYMQFMMSKMDVGVGKDASGKMRSVDRIQSKLLAVCLFDESNAAVQESVIQAFPASTQNELYKIASSISGMDEKAEEAAKNV